MAEIGVILFILGVMCLPIGIIIWIIRSIMKKNTTKNEFNISCISWLFQLLPLLFPYIGSDAIKTKYFELPCSSTILSIILLISITFSSSLNEYEKNILLVDMFIPPILVLL